MATHLAQHADQYHSWDEWVPQERLRKLTDDNKELANNLKKDMDAQRRAASGKPPSTSTKKRALGSDLTNSSARGSEDRSSVAPMPPRGTKRGREIEGIDRVSAVFLLIVWKFWFYRLRVGSRMALQAAAAAAAAQAHLDKQTTSFCPWSTLLRWLARVVLRISRHLARILRVLVKGRDVGFRAQPSSQPRRSRRSTPWNSRTNLTTAKPTSC